MAAVSRQPFAPLDGTRLQILSSAKNKQNALPSVLLSKRKVPESAEIDNYENVDPSSFTKRHKGTSGGFPSKHNGAQPFLKPMRCTLPVHDAINYSLPATLTLPIDRTILKPKAPSAKIPALATARLFPPVAPAERPSKRIVKGTGLLSSRRRAAYAAKHEKRSSSLTSTVPFSFDDALKGTLSAYSSQPSMPNPNAIIGQDIDTFGCQSSWDFEIHEDTPEQEMTNLLQHHTCVLDISSDEETDQRVRREKAEGKDKENIPPSNDVSQTTRARADAPEDMSVEKSRNPLAQLKTSDFYATGCDENSVVIIQSDEDDDEVDNVTIPAGKDSEESDEVATCQTAGDEVHGSNPEKDEMSVSQFDFPSDIGSASTVEELMTRREELGAGAAVLEPLEGTGESFELWESGSAKEDDLVSQLHA